MAEEGKLAATAEAVKGAIQAVPVYQDAIQPGAKQIGTALETVGKAINLLLTPISAAVWGYNQFNQLFLPALQEKLINVAQDKLLSPKPMIAGPIVESLRFAGSDPTLREMYVNLLASAMNKETSEKAHPAFVEIIRQITPDEARLLRFIHKNLRIGFDVPSDTRENETRIRVVIPSGIEHLDLFESYVDNLERLQLARRAHMTNIRNGKSTFSFSLSMTTFGNQFYAACMA